MASIVETILKSKALGYFLILWGLTFLIRSIVDFEYYILNWGQETLVETTTWIIYDAVSVGAAITLFVVAAAILKAKNQVPPPP